MPADAPVLASTTGRRGAFQLAIFLGAFLLFLIQPLIAKRILPWFGGGPAVWSTTLLFFQLALVGGYAYAHLTRRLGARHQIALHVPLLIISAATLSILPAADWKPPDAASPASRVLTLLAAHVGVPFVLLAATAPLLQDWHARVFPRLSPYRLYALSNAGSLLALLTYPFVVEPWLTLPAQARVWTIGYVIYVAVCAASAWQVRRTAPTPATTAPAIRTEAPPSAGHQLGWVLLPALGTVLLLATTSEVTQNVAPVPLLWVVPLAIYLATYIVAFADRYHRRWWALVWLPAVIGGGLVLGGAGLGSLPAQAAAYLAALAVGCLLCHGEVARLRPPVGYLTDYYLALAVGGGLGGVFVALVAPMIFDSYVEMRLAYVATTALAVWVLHGELGRSPAGVRRRAVTVGAVIVVVAAGVRLLVRDPDALQVLLRSRNFYGVVSVADDPPGSRQPRRHLYHGQILHGLQFHQPPLSQQPVSYYAEGSGLDIAIREHPRRVRGEPLTIGVVGLGAGTVAAFGMPGDRVRFFELDPDVVDIARRYFTYLGDSKATVDVVTGDGRLSLEREAANAADGRNTARYDVLALDAFTGDAVPVHLLTREAFRTYRSLLRADGVIAVNISNRYLDLRPVVRAQAADLGMEMRFIVRAEDSQGATRSSWLLVTRNEALLTRYPQRSTDRSELVWTDAFSSLLPLLR